MYRKTLTALALFLALTVGSRSAARAAGASGPSRANPWFVLLEDGAAASVVPNAQAKTNTASIVLVLAATASAAAALLWCRRMTEQLASLSAGILTAQEKRAVAQATAEYNGLSARLDELGRAVDARLGAMETAAEQVERRVGHVESRLERIDSDTRQLESRTVEAERICRLVGPMAEDLARLSQFRSQVEQIHGRIRKAFNGTATQASPNSASGLENLPGQDENKGIGSNPDVAEISRRAV